MIKCMQISLINSKPFYPSFLKSENSENSVFVKGSNYKSFTKVSFMFLTHD